MVKKLKAPPLRVRDLLVDATPAQLAARWKNRPGVIDDLFAWVFDDDVDDDRVRYSAAAVLCHLGQEKPLVAEWIDLMADIDEEGEDHEDDDAVDAVAVVLGDHADPAVVGPMLLELLETTLAEGAPLFCWRLFLEPLARFAARGWRDERTWSWLERLRVDEPDRWCSFVNGYGDPRAIPFLEAIIDAHAAALDDLEHLSDDDRVVVEALASRASLDAPPRAVDVERLARLDAWHAARAALR